MIGSPVLNGLDMLGGVLLKVEAGPYSPTSPTYQDLGTVKGFQIAIKGTTKLQDDADNTLWPIYGYQTKMEATISFEAFQANLKLFSMAMDELLARAYASAGVSQIYPIGQPTAPKSWSLRISAPNISLKPSSDVFTQRVHVIHKAIKSVDTTIKLGKGVDNTYKFTYHVLLDTTITPTATDDGIGYIADYVTPV